MLVHLQAIETKPANPFYSLPALAPPKPSDLRDELERYLSTDPESVEDVLLWWHGKRATFPHLSRMALDYLSIPGMFILSCIQFCAFHSISSPQPPQPMLKGLLAKAESYCHTSETDSVYNQRGPSCAWEYGVY